VKTPSSGSDTFIYPLRIQKLIRACKSRPYITYFKADQSTKAEKSTNETVQNQDFVEAGKLSGPTRMMAFHAPAIQSRERYKSGYPAADILKII